METSQKLGKRSAISQQSSHLLSCLYLRGSCSCHDTWNIRTRRSLFNSGSEKAMFYRGRSCNSTEPPGTFSWFNSEINKLSKFCHTFFQIKNGLISFHSSPLAFQRERRRAGWGLSVLSSHGIAGNPGYSGCETIRPRRLIACLRKRPQRDSNPCRHRERVEC